MTKIWRTKKKPLQAAIADKASDEEFLSKLLEICAQKKEEFAQRKASRANEDAAIAEAISILNSDAAFATFGTVDATKTGATGADFVQLKSVQLHVPKGALIEQLQEILSK